MARREFDHLFPQYEKIEEPLLLLLYINGGQHYAVHARDTYEPLAEYFRLSPRARAMSRAEYFGDGKTELRAWDNMVQWARRKLKDNGYLAPSPHGVWKLSMAGVFEAERALKRLTAQQASGLRFPKIEPADTTFFDAIREINLSE
jgi:restriction endonuclease Mrr